jgi:dephospho-CoA kinase
MRGQVKSGQLEGLIQSIIATKYEGINDYNQHYIFWTATALVTNQGQHYYSKIFSVSFQKIQLAEKYDQC